MNLTKIYRELASEVDRLEFSPPVEYVYNPLVYARRPFETFLKRFGKGTKEVVLVGMNPGPFGMAQTGVPFGDVEMVREWLGIEATVGRPEREHEKRPVEGFGCPRREVSGTRLWSWARDRFGTPERFFERFFVMNYCPLVFMEESGRNRTPDRLRADERETLFAACDRALVRAVEATEAKHVVGIGAFAEKRIIEAMDGSSVETGRILHPSPASPAANKGWAEKVDAQLGAMGIDTYEKPGARRPPRGGGR
ncbi:MAG: single-strand selective monofunctional uracil-DNA glycosylase [Deltaproteobacteria bacterium]|nr:single-strand selective monofunctional uracil-DNA glycosylase [Deltaproteobacteria bacterium]